MNAQDVIDEIISDLDVEDVPAEFIIMAKITDFQGIERIVQGNELQEIMDHPERYQIAHARVVLNVKKLRRAIVDETQNIYAAVEQRLSAK